VRKKLKELNGEGNWVESGKGSVRLSVGEEGRK
jgi:hypothetical protein